MLGSESPESSSASLPTLANSVNLIKKLERKGNSELKEDSPLLFRSLWDFFFLKNPFLSVYF